MATRTSSRKASAASSTSSAASASSAEKKGGRRSSAQAPRTRELEPERDANEAKAQRLTQAERRALAEQRILDAALELVARRGSVRMTLAEVGEAAGYSRGLPAHRFGNKAGLLKMLVMSIGARFEAHRMAMAPRKPGMDALRGQIQAYFDRDDKRWIETRALLVMLTEGFMEDSDLNPHIGDYVRSSIGRTEQHIRDGIARGEIRADIDPTAAATVLVGALRGVLHQRLVLGDLELAGVRDMVMEMVDRTLRPD